MARDAGRSSEFGLGLLTLSAVVLLVAWPPPGTGVPSPIESTSAQLAGPVSGGALLLGLAAGALYGRRFARRYESVLLRLGIGVVGTVVPVGLGAAYLVYVVGFGPRSPVVFGSLVLALVVGGLLEVPN